MKENLEYWTNNDFQAFLLVYAASSDLTVKSEELKQILEKTGYAAYMEILPVFQAQSDYERLQTILYFKPKYFATEEKVKKLIAKIQAMYTQDQNFSQAEQGILLLLRKILH